MNQNGSPPTVAVVLPGGGTRGAYEVGAMSVLLPALEARGERVSIYCGTSVGAINTALLASVADRPAAEQAELGIARWAGMRKSDTVRPIIGLGLPVTALRFIGDVLGIPGVRLASLLDPSPLAESLEGWIDWLSLYRNVRRGELQAACVMATGLRRGGPVAFVQTRGRMPAPSREIHYARVALAPEHVRASAAIPMLFPPVEIHGDGVSDHYIDGGTRLNSPIKPALALGADRIIVIGFEPPRGAGDAGGAGDGGADLPRPAMTDVLANVLDGLLLDRVSADLQRLVAVNSFHADSAASGPSTSARAYREARGREPYKRIQYALVSPDRRGEVGRIAEETYRERYSGWHGLRELDYPVMSRLLGGRTARSRGELLSFLFFDEVFVERLIALGQQDARRWLERHPNFWCADASHDFATADASGGRSAERAALSEWRELRRR